MIPPGLYVFDEAVHYIVMLVEVDEAFVGAVG